MISAIVGLTILTALFVILPSTTSSLSEEFTMDPKFITDDNVILQQKIISMNIPHDNTLPWAFVEGKVINPA